MRVSVTVLFWHGNRLLIMPLMIGGYLTKLGISTITDGLVLSCKGYGWCWHIITIALFLMLVIKSHPCNALCCTQKLGTRFSLHNAYFITFIITLHGTSSPLGLTLSPHSGTDPCMKATLRWWIERGHIGWWAIGECRKRGKKEDGPLVDCWQLMPVTEAASHALTLLCSLLLLLMYKAWC